MMTEFTGMCKFLRYTTSVTDTAWMGLRLAVIGFCLGLNVILGAYFLAQAGTALPQWAAELLYTVGFVKDRQSVQQLTNPIKSEPDLSTFSLLSALNEARVTEGVPELIEEPILSSASEAIKQELAKHDYLQENAEITKVLEAELKAANYTYEWVSQHTLIGPFYTSATTQAIMQSEDQSTALYEPDFSRVGIATEIIDHPKLGKVGVTVLLFAKPAASKGTVSQKISAPTPKPLVFPPIADSEVIQALNQYRSSHNVHQLVEHAALCKYAEKRVADLIAYGGLDNHEGFKKDFADPENPPEQLKDYSGARIGENLAYQHCRNMQTGDSFIAQSGAALIEWCFDSSTKGHREAQLDSRYNNVCVRHSQGYYVVVFGE